MPKAADDSFAFHRKISKRWHYYPSFDHARRAITTSWSIHLPLMNRLKSTSYGGKKCRERYTWDSTAASNNRSETKRVCLGVIRVRVHVFCIRVSACGRVCSIARSGRGTILELNCGTNVQKVDRFRSKAGTCSIRDCREQSVSVFWWSSSFPLTLSLSFSDRHTHALSFLSFSLSFSPFSHFLSFSLSFFLSLLSMVNLLGARRKRRKNSSTVVPTDDRIIRGRLGSIVSLPECHRRSARCSIDSRLSDLWVGGY